VKSVYLLCTEETKSVYLPYKTPDYFPTSIGINIENVDPAIVANAKGTQPKTDMS
jgi:hypothetical protein